MDQLSKRIDHIQSLIDSINAECKLITKDGIIFSSDVSVKVKYSSAEHSFESCISWLYVIFFEAFGRNYEFLSKKFSLFGIPLSNDAIEFPKLIHAFRTVLQHNLDLQSKSDKEKLYLTESWFNELINNNKPKSESDWTNCTNRIIDITLEILESVRSILKKLADSEHIDIIVEDWIKIEKRNFSVYDYEKVLIQVLHNNGLDNFFDTNKIAKKQKEEWKKRIDVLPEDFDFETEVYKIIEAFILQQNLIPIDGNDIIQLGVKPGPEVFKILTSAKDRFYRNPCPKEDLLKFVSSLLSNNPN